MATAKTTTVYSHITKDPEICGGRACVDGTRIRVLDIVALQHQGCSPAKMLEAYPSLNLAQIHAALSYYYENVEEIERAIQEDRDAADRVERARAEFLQKHSAG